jgi:hypothetical protein
MFATEPKLQYFSYDTGRFDVRSMFQAHLADALGCPALDHLR